MFGVADFSLRRWLGTAPLDSWAAFRLKGEAGMDFRVLGLAFGGMF